MTARWGGGVLLAALAAGPMVVLPVAITGMVAEVRTGISPAGTLGALPFILLVAAVVGFVVAIVPALATAGLLAWAGNRRRFARSWFIWAVTGLGVATVIGCALTGEWAAANLVFGTAGVPCALLARWRTRWID